MARRGQRPRIAALAVTLALLAAAVWAPCASAAAGKAAPLALSGEEQAYIEAHAPLRVGYVQDRIPVSFTDENGALAGISRSIFDRAAALTGMQFEYVPLPSGSVTYDDLMALRLDLITSVEDNRQNQEARGILISEPYLSSRKVVVARQDLEFSYDAPHTVAIVSGSQTLKKVLHEAYPRFSLQEYESITDCFSAVDCGEADLLIQNQYIVEYWISKPAYEDLKVIPVLGMADELCFSAMVDFTGAGSPTEAEGQLLIGILNKAIAAMDEEEIGSYTIQAIMENQYTYTFGDFLYRYRLAAGIVVLAVLIISTLVFLLLRQRVRSMEARADAKAKGQFLSTMSHEIRTPLNGLIGLNHLMAQNLDDRERLAGQLKRSTVTANYLLSLVNDILDMSKLGEDKMELEHRPLDLALLIDTVAAIEQNGMAEKGIDFRVESALTAPCVSGDETRIQQVLMNLLDNARKFTPAGGTVTLKVWQTPGEEGAVYTNASVTDTGRGMSEEFQKHVFDAFAQERDTVSKGNQGTGLGLPISRSLARLMGGDLTFTSEKGRGSSFLFRFPALPAALPAPRGRAPAAAARPRVLVAEDNELNAEIMLELLGEEGFEAALARDGAEALRMFRESAEGEYGVILMDLLMPNMDGYAAAAAIRALPRADAARVRIIACTANSFAEERQKALDCGMDDFLPKPVEVERLLEMLGGQASEKGEPGQM